MKKKTVFFKHTDELVSLGWRQRDYNINILSSSLFPSFLNPNEAQHESVLHFSLAKTTITFQYVSSSAPTPPELDWNHLTERSSPSSALSAWTSGRRWDHPACLAAATTQREKADETGIDVITVHPTISQRPPRWTLHRDEQGKVTLLNINA